MAKRKLTAQEKLQLVLESLRGDVKTSEMCRQHDIWPTELNRFKQKALPRAVGGSFCQGNLILEALLKYDII